MRKVNKREAINMKTPVYIKAASPTQAPSLASLSSANKTVHVKK